MNERIRQLAEHFAEQATSIVEMVGPQGYTSSYAKFDREKFAELIVQECLMIVYERQVLAPTDDDGYFKVALDMVSKDIEQHFGVEE
jgi:hypothetical protein